MASLTLAGIVYLLAIREFFGTPRFPRRVVVIGLVLGAVWHVEFLRVPADADDDIHRYVWDGGELSAIAPATGAQVRLGESMYVDGSSSGDTTSLNARSVIFGDLEAIAGTIGAIDALDETVRLNELITNEAIMVHVKPAGLRLVAPGPESLQAIDFGDLREGDSVIVLRRPDDPSELKIDGVALLVSFGEPTSQGISRQITWKLMRVGLGLP